MKEYEVITIFNTTGGVPLEEAKKNLQEILKRHSVRPAREEDWGEKKLHHDIDKIKSGHFIHQTCKMDPSKVNDIKKEMQLEQSILRFMVKRAVAV